MMYAAGMRVVMACACLALVVFACSDDATTAAAGPGGQGASTNTGGGGSGAEGGSGAAGGSGGGSFELVDHEVFGSGTRLRAQYVDAGGGAINFYQFFDTVLDVPCSFRTHVGGDARCVPPSAFNNDQFSDAACTIPVAASNTNNCSQAPSYVIDSNLDSIVCTTTASYGAQTTQTYSLAMFELGPEVALATVYALDDQGACVGSTTSESFHYWTIGDEVPLDTFVGASEVTELRGPRAEVTKLVGDDGSYVVSSVSDADLGFECDIQRRCLPKLRADIERGFSDDQCMTPVGVRRIDPSGCPTPSVIHESVSAGQCNPPVENFYAVGAEVPGASVYISAPPDCSDYGSDVGNLDEYEFYTLGALMPADTYFPIERVDRGTSNVVVRRAGLPTGELLGLHGSFFDTASGDRFCVPVEFESGTARCVPNDELVGGAGSGYYSDSACTDRIYKLSVANCPPGNTLPTRIAVSGTELACVGGSQNSTVAEVREAVPHAGTVYVGGAGGSCIATGGTNFVSPGALVDEAVYPEVQVATD